MDELRQAPPAGVAELRAVEEAELFAVGGGGVWSWLKDAALEVVSFGRIHTGTFNELPPRPLRGG